MASTIVRPHVRRTRAGTTSVVRHRRHTVSSSPSTLSTLVGDVEFRHALTVVLRSNGPLFAALAAYDRS